MKIRSLFAGVMVLALAPLSASHAQVLSNETALLGGLVSATVSGADVADANRRTAAMGALQFVHPFTTMLGFQTEFGIIQKGASIPLGGSAGDITLKLSYLEIPAMLRIGFAGKYSELRPALFFGPAAALNIGCQYKVPTQGSGSIESDCQQGGPEISAFDFSLVGGGSLEFGNFGVFARYDHGLRTIDSSDDKDDVRNRAFILGAMWSMSSR